MKVFLESIEVQSVASDFSLYAGSKFACHSGSLNMSITKANIGFLALAERDIPLSFSSLESAMKVGTPERTLRNHCISLAHDFL